MKNNFFRYVLQLMSSNVFAIIVSFMSTIVIPLVLDKHDYGMYRTFLVYVPYLAIFHLGFVDGVLIKESGNDIKDIDKDMYRHLSMMFIYLETILFILSFFVSLLFPINNSVRIMIFFLFLYGFITNLLTYYQFISRSTFRFSELSSINFAQSILMLLIIVTSLLLYFYKVYVNYYYYILSNIFISLLALLYYLYKYRDITFGNYGINFNLISVFAGLLKKGILLTIGFEVMTFMFNIDNQFLSYVNEKNVYANYSFAYSLAGLILSISSVFSTVLLPYINKMKKIEIRSKFNQYYANLQLFLYILISSYFIIILIINNYFIKYRESIVFIKYVFAQLPIFCVISTLLFNVFISTGKLKKFVITTITNIIFSIPLMCIIYIYTNSDKLICQFSVLAEYIWLFSLLVTLSKVIKIDSRKNYIFGIIMSMIFVLSTYFGVVLGFIIYIIFLLSYAAYYYYFCKITN